MTTKELLGEHPFATITVKEWLYRRMMESFDETTVDPDFKQMMFNDSLNDERLSLIIDGQPSALFEMFDEHDIYIGIHVATKESYQYTVNDAMAGGVHPTRKIAEKFILEMAFSYLEQKLQLIEDTKKEEKL